MDDGDFEGAGGFDGLDEACNPCAGVDFGEFESGEPGGSWEAMEPCDGGDALHLDEQGGADTVAADEALSDLSDYMYAHEYAAWSYGEYSQDPELQELHDAAYPSGEGAGEGLDHLSDQLEIQGEISAYEHVIDGVNPGYDPFVETPYNTNCGSCALAVFGRLSGTDPQAVSSVENVGTIEEMNRITGLTQTPGTADEIKALAEERGPGFHAICGFDRQVDKGHWFNVAVSNSGRVYALDGQSGKVELFDDYVKHQASDAVRFDISI